MTPGQTIVIDGTLTLAPGAITVIQFDPNNPNVPVQVNGAIDLDGTLSLVLPGGFAVSNGTVRTLCYPRSID